MRSHRVAAAALLASLSLLAAGLPNAERARAIVVEAVPPPPDPDYGIEGVACRKVVDPLKVKPAPRSAAAPSTQEKCGCDGVWYLDRCAANAAGVSLSSGDACPAH